MYEKKYFVGSICIFSHQENCGHVKSTCKSCTKAVNREKKIQSTGETVKR